MTPGPPPGAKPDFSQSWGGGGLSEPRPAGASWLVGDSKSADRAVCSGASWLRTCSASTRETSEGKGSREQTPEAPHAPHHEEGAQREAVWATERHLPAAPVRASEAPLGLTLPGQGDLART